MMSYDQYGYSQVFGEPGYLFSVSWGEITIILGETLFWGVEESKALSFARDGIPRCV